MARLIDADEAVKFFRGKCVAKYPSTFSFGLFAAADEVAKMETVDAVEVVRCKDCFWWHDFETHMDCRNPFGIDLPNPDDYCSSGERRTDG